ncbi:Uncharacterized protein CK203_081550 [Vitis vinifera]|uniref:Pentatricopeptide repeat-containing protein n=1 Tax=Vitis vinifera TaxID=29760 RepID=A0A438E2S1_VITVI|nr:Uncharacterized protein CK203_081550 [Vitis vinifera]
MIESTMAFRFRAGAGARAGLFSTAAVSNCRATWSSDEAPGVHVASRRLSHSGSFDAPRTRFIGVTSGSFTKRRNPVKHRFRVSAEHLGSREPQYHPFEEIVESSFPESGEARLTAAETTRTVIEVNNKATLMFSNLINNEVHENIFWPELPYVTDEHGNIYFQVNNDEDIMQSLTSENNFVRLTKACTVTCLFIPPNNIWEIIPCNKNLFQTMQQVIIGLDTSEMLNEMELTGPAEIDFGIEEIEDEDSDIDYEDDENDDDDDDEDEDDEQDWVAILEDEEDQEDSDEAVASGDPVDWMNQPPAGIAIQGLLRPALIEEQSVIQKHISSHQSSNANVNQVEKNSEDKAEDLEKINGHGQESGSSRDNSIQAEDIEKDYNMMNGFSFYKLEMIKILLISAHGLQAVVDLEDFRNAQPDAIAHSASKIISRLKAGGEKTTQALKSLCWRCKGIQVEEATLIGVDTLGFDLRVCSGRQVQTLRLVKYYALLGSLGPQKDILDFYLAINTLMFVSSEFKMFAYGTLFFPLRPSSLRASFQVVQPDSN